MKRVVKVCLCVLLCPALAILSLIFIKFNETHNIHQALLFSLIYPCHHSSASAPVLLLLSAMSIFFPHLKFPFNVILDYKLSRFTLKCNLFNLEDVTSHACIFFFVTVHYGCMAQTKSLNLIQQRSDKSVAWALGTSRFGLE